jgi:hypothetical protein
MLTGEVQVSFLSPLTAHAQLKAGKVKALAVSSAKRFAGAPEIPSAAEAGIPGMDVRLWFGLFAPAKTPKSVVAKLNREIGDILRAPETQETFLKQGVAAAPGTSEELGEWVKTELARWTPVIQAASGGLNGFGSGGQTRKGDRNESLRSVPATALAPGGRRRIRRGPALYRIQHLVRVPGVYSTNYQKGALLPAGSEVKDVDRSSRNLEFTDVKTGTRFKAEFVSKHHPGVTRDQWIDRFLTTKDFGALTRGLTPTEIQAVRLGRVQSGMSKKAVLVSAGYPPETGTASTKLDAWKYWRNRFAYYSVQFGGGKVTNSAQ